MEATFSAYLGGFSGFSRSFNRSVLAHDHRLHQDYRNALNHGSLPCNRLRILTIGDKGVGKSSTLQYLQGNVCNPHAEPQATEGIEITICETSECDPAWKPCSDGVCTAADDPGLNAAWCVCERIDSLGGTLHKDKPNSNSHPVKKLLSCQNNRKRKNTKKCTSTQTPEKVFQRIMQLSLCMLYQIEIAVPAILLFILNPFVNNGYGVVCWLSIFTSVPLFKNDFNSSYRCITSVGLQIIAIDIAVTAKEYFSFGADGIQEDASPCQWWDVSVFLSLAAGSGSLSLLFGLLCGTGCRSGMAIAFCLMTHQSVVRKHIKVALAMIIGNLIGMLMLRGGLIFSPSRKNIRMYSVIILALLMFIGLLIQLQQFYVSDVLIGMVMGNGYPYGLLKGRAIVAERKLRLPYYVKKTFGFVVGIVISHLVGWRMIIRNGDLVSIVCSVLAALGFLFYDFSVAKKVWYLENKQGIPISTIRYFLMDSANKDNPVTIKLHFWDNAGGSIYQTMQQFFRPAEAVYLLVFSLKSAVGNEDWQLDRLRQWLFTLKAHSKNPTTLVFMVGTHRDSVTKEFLDSFAAQIDGQLYKDFCSILAINGDKGPLYTVENSTPMDDGMILRQSILNIAKTTPLMTELFPIRYLSILNKIKELQSDDWIITTTDLLDKIAEEGMTIGDLQKVLARLHRTGDVIYRGDDEILKEYVVITPQNLLDVLKTVVCIPPKASRNLNEADDWSVLEEKGVASLKLIKSVVGSDTLLHCVIRLMKAYNLAIPAHSARPFVPYSNGEVDFSRSASDGELPSTPGESANTPGFPCYFIIPSHLPEFTGVNADIWEPSQQDEEYFFDFGYVSADSIFHRLLAKCWCDRDDGELVYNTRGRFRYQQANFYTIRLQKMSVSQNTIQVTILHDGHNCCSLKILRHLRQHLEEIRQMDFPKLPYTCGPVCRVCSTEDRLRVLKVCGDDKEFPTNNMQYETFMGLGKYHKVYLTPQLWVNCGRRSSSPELSSFPSTSTSSGDVPPLHPSISVGETANRVTVITTGDNARFDIHGTK